MNNKRIFPEWFINELVDEEDREKARNGELKTTDRVNFRCERDHIYSQEVRNHITLKSQKRRFGCPICAEKLKIGRNNYAIREKGKDEKYKLLTSKRKRIYPEWFINELANEDEKSLILENKLHVRNKVKFKCTKCGNIYKQQIRLHIKLASGERNQGCPKCASIKRNVEKSERDKDKRVYPDWFINELADEEAKIKAKDKDLKSEDRVKFKCEKGHIYESSVGNHIRIKDMQKKHGCPICGMQKSINGTINSAKDKRKDYPQWFIDELVNEEDKELAKTRKLTTNEKVMFRCQKGHVYEQNVHLHLKSDGSKGCSCPYCSNNRSKAELEIEDYIASLGFKTEHRRFTSSIMPNFEIDIFIPEQNIGIEYNSIYYHKTLPVEDNSKDKNYHLNKFKSCKENGIRLISIFEQDYRGEKKEKILSFLKDALLNNQKRVFARKCEVRSVSREMKTQFFDTYHISKDSSQGTICYGLFYNNELISCMSFGKLRGQNALKDKVGHFELVRFVTKNGIQVVGGASKLFTAFLREYNPKYILCYSDNTFFTGSTYKQLGFKFVNNGESSLNYQWVSKNDCKERQSCMVFKLLKKYPEYLNCNITGSKEDYIMQDLGYYKIYRCGNSKWVWCR